MSAVFLGEIRQPVTVPRLLIELPSRPRIFYENLRDLILPASLPALELRSTPALFWSDVMVERGLPWRSFLQSGAYHVMAFALLIAFTRFFALQPQVVAKPAFDHSQVVYYQPSEYLPPLDSRSVQRSQPAQADPEFSRQPIISVPREADNRSQTIVTPPHIKLKRDIALPDIVDWSEKTSEKMLRPRLAIPPAPLTPAADLNRIVPRLDNSVAAPPPDAAHLMNRRSAPVVYTSVIAPPSSVEVASVRPIGDLNISQSSIIAPAPQLPLAEQRALPGPRSAGIGAPQLVPPPAPVSAAAAASDVGRRGHFLALSLHPTLGAPPDPPAGNRRGAFSATPDGHSGATGSPGVNSGNSTSRASGNDGRETGSGSDRKGSNDVPAGLYVGSPVAKSSPVAGDEPATSSVSTKSVNPNLMASVRPPRVTSAPSRPESAAKLSEVERAVFGNRKFYSLTLSMPNLNSAGGSWFVRFAELDHDPNHHDSNNPYANNHDPRAPSGELSEPAATRKVDPAYPLQLMRENVGGTVILYAVIHADGTVGNVRVLRSVDQRLDRFASQAIAQWKFQPAMKNGSPVEVEATFQIPFRPARTNF
ncbi:MAG TPA: TonB family protein [Candidatus Sulfotelmatobacter sp.]